MTMIRDVHTIVAEWLTKHGYDGLFNSDCCACRVGNLMPCDEPQTHCTAGVLVKCDPETCELGCDWHIGPRADSQPCPTCNAL